MQSNILFLTYVMEIFHLFTLKPFAEIFLVFFFKRIFRFASL